MNRLILKYAYPLTGVILVVFAWVVYQRIAQGWGQVVVLGVAALVVWLLATPAFIYFWPRITVNGYKRAILKRGFGDGPIPVNTLYAAPTTSAPSVGTGSLLATGTNDVLYIGGWLDLREGPQVLHVPDTAGRYYSVQFTNPSDSANFAYVGKRTTGTGAGEFLLTGPRWKGQVPNGMRLITSPSNSALVIGRVFVESEADLPAAYALAKRIHLTPLGE